MKQLAVTLSALTLIFTHLTILTCASDNLVKITSTIMIENDGLSPLNHYLIERDDRNKSRLSHIVAKLDNNVMPVQPADDGKLWRIDLSSKPIEPGAVVPLTVTKVYTHLELVPSRDIYLIPYAQIQYQARIIKQGRPQKIKLPSEQYYLTVDDKELIDLDESASTVMALGTEGTTRISFIDKKVITDEDFIQPSCNIHIVSPSYLTMHISPGDSWALQKFTDYSVEIKVFDEHHHQIYPSDNLDIQLEASSELVITTSTTNGTFHTIHSLASSGAAKLTARLLGTTPINYSFGRPLEHVVLTKELTIHDALDIKPTAFVLPWIPELQPSYQLSIYADGGTGVYKWSTNNTDLIDITYNDEDSSVAKITTQGEGTAFIICSASKSPVFTKHAMIALTKIDEISVLPSVTETEVGGSILVPVAAYANVSSILAMHLPTDEVNNGLVLFHDCSKIRFKVDVVEKTRFSHDPTEILPNSRPKACMSLKFTCNQPGTSRIWISYSDTIKTTTLIACYKPLKPVFPNDVGVLAVGTSIEVAFEGGPRPFASRYDDHYAKLEADSTGILTLEHIVDRFRFNKDLHVFRATCQQYGESQVTLNVGNQASPTLTNPASAQSSIQIVCAKPNSIQVRPHLKDTCPLNDIPSLAETVVPVSSKVPTDFELIMFDDSKRRFLNISSYNAVWSHQGPIKSSTSQQEDINAVAGFRKSTRNYITLHPSGQEGFAKLQATIPNLKFELELQFVDTAKISFNKTIVLNHPKNVVGLSIVHGSGHFSVEALQGAVHANVSYASLYGKHKITITPLAIGDFIVKLEDQCIESKSVLSEVSIVSSDTFKKEVFKQENTMHFCDDMTFCLYLNVQKLRQLDTQASRPKPTKAALPSSIQAAAVVSPSPISSTQATTTQKVVEVVTHVPLTTTTKPLFNEPITTTLSQTVEGTEESSLIKKIAGLGLLIVIALGTLTVWKQQQEKKNPPLVYKPTVGVTPSRNLSCNSRVLWSDRSLTRMNTSADFTPGPSTTRGSSGFL